MRGLSPLVGLVLLAVGACAPASGATASVTGTLTYRERVALPAGAEVRVAVEDVTLADAAPPVLAETRFKTAGEQVPLRFTVRYDPGAVRSARRYAIRAEIRLDGRLTWVSALTTYVITQDQPTRDLEVVLQRY